MAANGVLVDAATLDMAMIDKAHEDGALSDDDYIAARVKKMHVFVNVVTLQ